MLAELEGLLVEALLLLASLLSGLECRLAELLRCLTSRLLLLLLAEIELSRLLPSLLTELEGRLLKLLLLYPTLDVLRFGRLTELLLRLKGSVVLLGGRQAKFCSPLPGLLSGLEGLGIKLLRSPAVRLVDLKGALLELLLGLPGLLFLLLSSEAKLCCTLTRLLPKLECALRELLLQGPRFKIGLERLLLKLLLCLPSRFFLLLRRQPKLSGALTRLFASLEGLLLQLLLADTGFLSLSKGRLTELFLCLTSSVFLLLCRKTEFCRSLPRLFSSLKRLLLELLLRDLTLLSLGKG